MEGKQNKTKRRVSLLELTLFPGPPDPCVGPEIPGRAREGASTGFSPCCACVLAGFLLGEVSSPFLLLNVL